MSVLRIGKSSGVDQKHLETLLTLGYEEFEAKKALECNSSVEAAVDWIEAHRHELVESKNQANRSTSQPPNSTTATIKTTNESHTTLTKGSNNNLVLKKEVLTSANVEIVSKESDDEAEKHKEFLQRQAQKIGAQQKRERQAMKEHEERLKAQLEEDRLEREAKYNKNKQQDPQPIVKTPSVNASIATKPSSNECTVQVKLLNGSTTTQVFLSDEKIIDLHNYIASLMDCEVNFTFVTPYPKMELSPSDLAKSFKELGVSSGLRKETRGQIRANHALVNTPSKLKL